MEAEVTPDKLLTVILVNHGVVVALVVLMAIGVVALVCREMRIYADEFRALLKTAAASGTPADKAEARRAKNRAKRKRRKERQRAKRQPDPRPRVGARDGDP